MFATPYNPILNTDSYKFTHYLQYPQDTEYVQSYIEPRGGIYEGVVFAGLQAFLKNYPLFIDQVDIEEAEDFVHKHGYAPNFNRQGWEYILKEYDGMLPVHIKAIPEGTTIPVRNAVLTIENTDPNVPWITSYLETALLRAIWYSSTVATRSRYIKILLSHYLEKSSDNPEAVNFMLHDFGSRGASSYESSALAGTAHLFNFMGSDNVPAVTMANHIYNEDMAAFSVDAAEHSTIMAWGPNGEKEAFRNMLRQFYGDGKIVSVVSDTYNIFEAVRMWCVDLKQEVLDSGITLVIRPDSGDPLSIIPDILNNIANYYGYTVNSKGYMVLNTAKVLWGDGINEDTINTICKEVISLGYSIENLVFGMGGELVQNLTRDTNEWAMKACAIKRKGYDWLPIHKNPVSGGSKRSKGGRLTTIKDLKTGKYHTVDMLSENFAIGVEFLMKSVYHNGEILLEDTLKDIRERTLKK